MNIERRDFLKKGSLGLIGLSAIPMIQNNLFAKPAGDLFFKISLAEWSLNRPLFGNKLTNLEFPAKAKNDFGITAVEYVNQFFKDKAEDEAYLKELKTRTDDIGVENVLIMIDAEGYLADQDDAKRMESVENHYKWVEAAKYLGCHSIRVNAHATSENPEEGMTAAVDGLGRLAEFAEPYNIGVIVENHGGFSSNGQWLSSVMKQVSKPNCGTLPDFGNFCIERAQGGCKREYDRYKGVKELMPWAKGVSAKTNAFDEDGNDVNIDYVKMLQIVKDAGYTGYIGIEAETRMDDPDEAIRLTKALLEKAGAQVS